MDSAGLHRYGLSDPARVEVMGRSNWTDDCWNTGYIAEQNVMIEYIVYYWL